MNVCGYRTMSIVKVKFQNGLIFAKCAIVLNIYNPMLKRPLLQK